MLAHVLAQAAYSHVSPRIYFHVPNVIGDVPLADYNTPICD